MYVWLWIKEDTVKIADVQKCPLVEPLCDPTSDRSNGGGILLLWELLVNAELSPRLSPGSRQIHKTTSQSCLIIAMEQMFPAVPSGARGKMHYQWTNAHQCANISNPPVADIRGGRGGGCTKWQDPLDCHFFGNEMHISQMHCEGKTPYNVTAHFKKIMVAPMRSFLISFASFSSCKIPRENKLS